MTSDGLKKKIILQCLFVILFCSTTPSFGMGTEQLTEQDKRVYQLITQCHTEVVKQLKLLLSSGQLSIGQLFDTFYIPIPNTSPQKYHTQYDTTTDEVLRPILDKYLDKDPQLVFVIAVDRNGYLPTHNTCYAQPITGNPQIDIIKNRTKRIFNDRTGLSAAKNQQSYLLQRYSRDTGEQMVDLSVPITINNRHWGAIRIGYKAK
ncbi:MAG: PDC sensor domain-containing protein [Thermodesulfobacteriota bacterium]|nr:PDC sensor domain-containing protein [Thermodesulfobacteriota bacterium]